MFKSPIAGGVSENVTLAETTLFGREDVTDGNVADVDPIEAGIDKAGHGPVKEIENDLACGSGFDIAWADRSGGVDDDNGKAAMCEIESDLFGLPL